MATYKLNKASTETWDINESGSIWILGDKGRITGTDINGIATVGVIDAATLRINGEIDLEGPQSRGVFLETDKTRIIVSDTGHISAEWIALQHENGNGSATIDNAGLLEAQYGISVYVEQGLTEITNSGRITATFVGINEDGAGATIVNSGFIKAVSSISIGNGVNDANPLDADSATYIINTGKIIGADNAIEAIGVAANIRNSGTLNGDVVLGAGEDVIDTRGGTINGNIELGGANDMLDARRATVKGAIYGGLGDDTVTLASAAQVFVEGAAEGIDSVRINGTYQLGENIENLTLLGKANHTGIGNASQNVLTGNKGANTLYGLNGGDTLAGGKGNDLLFGGTGADVFVFKAGWGKDTIADFEDGSDIIELHGFQNIVDFGDLTIDDVGNDKVITFSDTDQLVIRDGAGMTLDGSDFDFNFV